MKHLIESGDAKVVVSSVGATILSFRIGDEVILYPWQRTLEGKERGGCPLCVPWFGLAPEFGKKKHGYLRDLEATTVTKNKEGNQLEFGFYHPGCAEYPWALSYKVKYSLKESSLSIFLFVERKSDGIAAPAPINIGFHPYFDGNAEDAFLIVNNSMALSGFSEKSTTISNVNSVSIEKKRHKILIETGQGSTLVCWSDNPEKYFCVEPVLTEKAFFNTPQGKSLGVGQAESMMMILSVI